MTKSNKAGGRVCRRFLFLGVLVGTILVPRAASAASPQVTTFKFTGGEQTYIVPPGLNAVTIVATGAAGGGPSSGLTAGRGAVVSAVVSVTPGEVLYVEVGGIGGQPAGGFNGGGMGATNTNVGLSEFGGGGASDVRLVSSSAVDSLNSRVLVAAGGGGSATPAAAGGDAGAGGGSSPGSSVGGGAGTQTAGGAGAAMFFSPVVVATARSGSEAPAGSPEREQTHARAPAVAVDCSVAAVEPASWTGVSEAVAVVRRWFRPAAR